MCYSLGSEELSRNSETSVGQKICSYTRATRFQLYFSPPYIGFLALVLLFCFCYIWNYCFKDRDLTELCYLENTLYMKELVVHVMNSILLSHYMWDTLKTGNLKLMNDIEV